MAAADLKPLKVGVQQYGTAEANEGNIRASLSRGLPELSPALCAHDGHLVIVGSGPSLPLFADELKAEREKGRPIVAIKGSHDFLCENGIEPDLFVSVEPRPRLENVKHKNPNTIYLLASRCSPELFDHLKDCKVMLWHSWSYEKECEVFKGRMGIGGGTTSGVRAINVGYVLGFRKFILYGMDSCLAEDKSTKRFTGEKAGQIVDVVVGDRKFWCNAALAQQANEFQTLYQVMPDITIEAKGDGLISAILAERRRLGYPT